jgi:hypothetical protein
MLTCPMLTAIVCGKLAPVSLIEQEYRAYRQHIHDRLSGVAEVRGEPVLVAGSAWGGLRYRLVGSGIFESESLNSFCRRAALDAADLDAQAVAHLGLARAAHAFAWESPRRYTARPGSRKRRSR